MNNYVAKTARSKKLEMDRQLSPSRVSTEMPYFLISSSLIRHLRLQKFRHERLSVDSRDS